MCRARLHTYISVDVSPSPSRPNVMFLLSCPETWSAVPSLSDFTQRKGLRIYPPPIALSQLGISARVRARNHFHTSPSRGTPKFLKKPALSFLLRGARGSVAGGDACTGTDIYDFICVRCLRLLGVYPGLLYILTQLVRSRPPGLCSRPLVC